MVVPTAKNSPVWDSNKLRKGEDHFPTPKIKLQIEKRAEKVIPSSPKCLPLRLQLVPKRKGQGQRNPQGQDQQSCNTGLLCRADGLMENATINGHVCLNLSPHTEKVTSTNP